MTRGPLSPEARAWLAYISAAELARVRRMAGCLEDDALLAAVIVEQGRRAEGDERDTDPPSRLAEVAADAARVSAAGIDYADALASVAKGRAS